MASRLLAQRLSVIFATIAVVQYELDKECNIYRLLFDVHKRNKPQYLLLNGSKLA